MRPALPYAIAACFALLLGGCDDPLSRPESPVSNETPQANAIDDAVGKIAYPVGAGGFDFDIYVGNPDGAGLVDVSDSDDWDTGPIFSPNAKQIVFSSDREGEVFDGDLFVMNADGTELRRLTYFGSAGNPHWSPSGRRIAFTSGRAREDAFSAFDIFVMDADGGNVRRLTTAPDQFFDIPWSWSPAGKRIAFYRTGAGTADGYLVNVDGSGETRLTNDEDSGLGAWSPNSQQIAFSRNDRPFIMYADGSGAEAIPLPAELDGKLVHAYDWSHP